MGIDAEGYGFPAHQKTIQRLIEDIRILSPSGVERAAQGWDKYARLGGLESIHQAEKAALHVIEQSGKGEAWDEIRRNLFGLTESGGALVSWKAEHGEVGHKAEDAAFMAALGLVAGSQIAKEQQAALLRPLSEALPWLLPEEHQPVA
jgi:hypothetical protein